MASSVTQAFNSINNGITNIGRDFGKLFGEQRGNGADAVDAVNNGTDEDKKKFLSGQYGSPVTQIGKSLEQEYQENLASRTEEGKVKQEEKNKALVSEAKKNSTAGTRSGRQGTIAGGTLLGGGAASIGSKTLLGQ